MAQKKDAQTWEFGDFQTPAPLARQAVGYLRKTDPTFLPKTIIEPTCGTGGFLLAAADIYPEAKKIIGLEIDEAYLVHLRNTVKKRRDKKRFCLLQGDFFKTDWDALLKDLPKPILILGNPPWVTNADIGKMQGENLPEKENIHKHLGLDAVTGKANFDISEWMLLKNLEWLKGQSGCIAVLCKTAVARKILTRLWQGNQPQGKSKMVQIDAMKSFGASVDACFLILRTDAVKSDCECIVFSDFETTEPEKTIGFRKGYMLSNTTDFNLYHSLLGQDPNYIWRSGVKHDCARVMELKITDQKLVNGYHETVDIEEQHLFPLLKSSDLGNYRTERTRLMAVIPQTYIGQPTSGIQQTAPRTWAYLKRHAEALEKRGSIIYKNKPPFSIFGVGDYTFTDWKLAISGFYKRLSFQVVGPINDKPVVFDDTIYFLNAASKAEAFFLSGIMNSDPAQNLLASMVFWENKRPITADLLKRVHIGKIASCLGSEREYHSFCEARSALPLFATQTAKAV